MGTSRCVAATSPFTVRMPSAGGVSTITKFVILLNRRERVFDLEGRVELPRQLLFQLGQGQFGWSDKKHLILRRPNHAAQLSAMVAKDVVHRGLHVGRVEERDG